MVTSLHTSIALFSSQNGAPELSERKPYIMTVVVDDIEAYVSWSWRYQEAEWQVVSMMKDSIKRSILSD